MKSSRMIIRIEVTTALVVASPTPLAPPWARNPYQAAVIGMIGEKIRALVNRVPTSVILTNFAIIA